MWNKELDPSQASIAEEMKIQGRVGDKSSWYSKQVDYWNVKIKIIKYI